MNSVIQNGLDFPRIGNNESFHYARRQFNLADDELLRHNVSVKHHAYKMICFEELVSECSYSTFHTTKSFTDYKVGVEMPGIYKMVLNSDEERFGGHNRLQLGSVHHTFPEGYNGRRNHLLVYAPARTCLVLRL
ncbi:alpha amylase, all-beta domain protein [Ostertagia ostertagi]